MVAFDLSAAVYRGNANLLTTGAQQIVLPSINLGATRSVGSVRALGAIAAPIQAIPVQTVSAVRAVAVAPISVAPAPVAVAQAPVAVAPIAVAQARHVGPVNAAIHSRYSVEVVNVPTQQEPVQEQVITVEPNVLPVNILFQSQSSPVNVQQQHIPGEPGQVQQTQSQDEPHRLVHEVLRPVIQEVREVIQPYRRVVQEIRPVVEEVNSIVAKGERRQQVVAAPQPVVAVQQPAVQTIAVQQPVVAQAIPVTVAAQPVATQAVSQPILLAIQQQPESLAVQQTLPTGGLLGGLVTRRVQEFRNIIRK